MKDKLDILLKIKNEIETPHGLEENIMRRIHNEKAKKRFELPNLFGRFSYGFALVAALLVAVSAIFTYQSYQLQKQESELAKIENDIKFYDTANKIFSEVESEYKLQKEMDKIQELDEYIKLLSS